MYLPIYHNEMINELLDASFQGNPAPFSYRMLALVLVWYTSCINLLEIYLHVQKKRMNL